MGLELSGRHRGASGFRMSKLWDSGFQVVGLGVQGLRVSISGVGFGHRAESLLFSIVWHLQIWLLRRRAEDVELHVAVVRILRPKRKT